MSGSNKSRGMKFRYGPFIRLLVGLDWVAGDEGVEQFLDGRHYSSQQTCFIEIIIDRLTRHGVMDPGQMYESPITGVHHEGLDGAFDDGDAQAIVDIVREINRRAAAQECRAPAEEGSTSPACHLADS